LTFFRRIFGILLIFVYVLMPWIPINGAPSLFFDIGNRRFHMFGLTLLRSRPRTVRKIIFDKTGTLTLECPVLANPEAIASLNAESCATLAQLTSGSLHPFSRSLPKRKPSFANSTTTTPSTSATGTTIPSPST
jgi:hypothetical protein